MFFIVLDFKIIEFFRSNSNTAKNAELSSRSANTKKQQQQQQQQHLRHCENEARKKMKLMSLPLDIPYTIPTINGVPRLLISFS